MHQQECLDLKSKIVQMWITKDYVHVRLYWIISQIFKLNKEKEMIFDIMMQVNIAIWS